MTASVQRPEPLTEEELVAMECQSGPAGLMSDVFRLIADLRAARGEIRRTFAMDDEEELRIAIEDDAGRPVPAAERLLDELRACRAKIKNLEDDVRYWQQEAESRG